MISSNRYFNVQLKNLGSQAWISSLRLYTCTCTHEIIDILQYKLLDYGMKLPAMYVVNYTNYYLVLSF